VALRNEVSEAGVVVVRRMEARIVGKWRLMRRIKVVGERIAQTTSAKAGVEEHRLGRGAVGPAVILEELTRLGTTRRFYFRRSVVVIVVVIIIHIVRASVLAVIIIIGGDGFLQLGEL
jgi:hypothetical protein